MVVFHREIVYGIELQNEELLKRGYINEDFQQEEKVEELWRSFYPIRKKRGPLFEGYFAMSKEEGEDVKGFVFGRKGKIVMLPTEYEDYDIGVYELSDLTAKKPYGEFETKEIQAIMNTSEVPKWYLVVYTDEE